MICTFCGHETETSFHFCVDCGNKLSGHLTGKIRFHNLRQLNAAVFADKDDTIDLCFDLLNPYQSEVKYG